MPCKDEEEETGEKEKRILDRDHKRSGSKVVATGFGLLDKLHHLLGAGKDGAPKGLRMTRRSNGSCGLTLGTIEEAIIKTYRIKPGVTSNAGRTPLSRSSVDGDISSVATILAIKHHALVSAKCLPGQTLFGNRFCLLVLMTDENMLFCADLLPKPKTTSRGSGRLDSGSRYRSGMKESGWEQSRSIALMPVVNLMNNP